MRSFGIITVIGLMSAMVSCNNGTGVSGGEDGSSALASASSVAAGSSIDQVCAALATKKLSSVAKEVAVLCTGGRGSPLAKNLLANAYHGKNSLDNATKEVSLKSTGNQTELIFAGALMVPKSIANMASKRAAVSALSMDDAANEITIASKLLGRARKNGGDDCYKTKEIINATVMGIKIEKAADLEECFVSLNKAETLVASFQTLIPGAAENQDDLTSNKLVIQIQSGSDATYLVSVVRKVVDNMGVAPIAEKTIRTQPKSVLAKFYAALVADQVTRTVTSNGPKFGDAMDNEQAGQGDWDFGRTKLSCKNGESVVGIVQQRLYGKATQRAATLSIECREFEKPASYRVEAPPSGIPTEYDIRCGQDEYVAGVSFVRYNDKATILADGTRSLLCAKAPRRLQSCSWQPRSCGAKAVLNGLRVKREGGLICKGGSQEDLGKGCYTTESVLCCNG